MTSSIPLSPSSHQWFGNPSLLPSDPSLHIRILPNGLRYILYPNHYPPNRFYCQLAINTGSINETDQQQGLAHVVEHGVFMGTEKYPTAELLRQQFTALGLAFNADSNAYTDFRETVYTLEGPLSIIQNTTSTGVSSSGQDDEETLDHADETDDTKSGSNRKTTLEAIDSVRPIDETSLPILLDILNQLVFHATFPKDMLETEKSAVLSEAAMRGTVEYRAEVLTITQMHNETNIPKRMPIGRTQLIKNYNVNDLIQYYQQWYRPQFMTLYIVGPFDTTQVESIIHTVFGPEQGTIYSSMNNSRSSSSSSSSSSNSSFPVFSSTTSDTPEIPWSVPPLLPYYTNKETFIQHKFNEPPQTPLVIAQHPLLPQVVCTITGKSPLPRLQTRTREQYADAVLDVILSTIFGSRLEIRRAQNSKVLFSSIYWDDSPAAEDGCSYYGLQIATDLKLQDTEDNATNNRTKEEGDDNDDGADDEEDGAEANEENICIDPSSPSSSSSSILLPSWYPIAWQDNNGQAFTWQKSITIAVEELLRMARYGPQPNELQLATASFIKDCKDRADAWKSTESSEWLSDIQDGIKTGSSIPNAVQEYEWTVELSTEITIERAKQRAKDTLVWIEEVVAEIVERLQRYEKSTEMNGNSSSSSSSVDSSSSSTLLDQLFTKLQRSISIFVCAPGPQDTITNNPLVNSSNSTSVNLSLSSSSSSSSSSVLTVGPYDLSPVLMGLDGQTFFPPALKLEDAQSVLHGGNETLLSRTSSISRHRQTLRRLITGTTDETDDDEDDEEDEDDDDDEEDDDEEEDYDDNENTHHQHSHTPRKLRHSSSTTSSSSLVPGSSSSSSSSSLLYPHTITPLQIFAAIAHGTLHVTPAKDIDIPTEFVTSEDIQQRKDECKEIYPNEVPRYLPVSEGFSSAILDEYGWNRTSTDNHHKLQSLYRLYDEETGFTTMRLWNGITLTYKRTTFEPHCLTIMVSGRGGRTVEGTNGWCPLGMDRVTLMNDIRSEYTRRSNTNTSITLTYIVPGSPYVGIQALMEGGVCNLSSDQIERACSLWGLAVGPRHATEYTLVSASIVNTTTLEPKSPKSFSEISTNTVLTTEPDNDSSSTYRPQKNPLDRAFQLLYGYVCEPNWDNKGFLRAKDDFLTSYDTSLQSLDARLMKILAYRAFTPAEAWVPPSKHVRKTMTMNDARMGIEIQLSSKVPHNLQIVVVGDIDPIEIETIVLYYFGCLPRTVPLSIFTDDEIEKRYRQQIPLPLNIPPSTSIDKRLDDNDLANGTVANDKDTLVVPLPVKTNGWKIPHRLLTHIQIKGTVIVHHGEKEPRCIVHGLFPFVGHYQELHGVPSDRNWCWPPRNNTDPTLTSVSPISSAYLRQHPLFLYRIANIVSEVANNRLYRVLRDGLGTCYATSFSTTNRDYSHPGYAEVNCTPLYSSAPTVITYMLYIVQQVLLGEDPITSQEMDEVVKPVLASLSTDTKANSFWAGAALAIHCHQSYQYMSSLHSFHTWWNHLTLDDIHYGLALIRRLLVWPLPVHLIVGITGEDVSFCTLKDESNDGTVDDDGDEEDSDDDEDDDDRKASVPKRKMGFINTKTRKRQAHKTISRPQRQPKGSIDDDFGSNELGTTEWKALLRLMKKVESTNVLTLYQQFSHPPTTVGKGE